MPAGQVLEKERQDRGAAPTVTTHDAETIAGPSGDQQMASLDLSGSLARVYNPISSFDPIINDIANQMIAAPAPREVIAAASDLQEVAQSMENIKSHFEIDAASDMTHVMTQLLVYYANNSTSPQTPHRWRLSWNNQQFPIVEVDKLFVPSARAFWRALADVMSQFILSKPGWMPYWGRMHGFPNRWRHFAFDTADHCSGIPNEARRAIQAAKDVALTRASFNLMQADLKAVGNGAGTVVEQVAGQQFANTASGRSQQRQ